MRHQTRIPSTDAGFNTPVTSEGELHFRASALVHMEPVRNRSDNGDGAAGDTAEYVLGLEPDNNPVADSWYELKTQQTTRAVQLFSCAMNPSPEPATNILRPQFGYTRADGNAFLVDVTNEWNNRGFRVSVDRTAERVYIEYDPDHVDDELAGWAATVPDTLYTVPYWEFDDLRAKVEAKVNDVLYFDVEACERHGHTAFNYRSAELWRGVDFEAFLNGFETGDVYVSFQAGPGYNSGTGIKVTHTYTRNLYTEVITDLTDHLAYENLSITHD